ncbi:MAG TPA: toxin-activating lysine-acyltransferase [Arenicellales bacterium]|nr:toxin-activating lysine-acyltransferase [Arenicellales bacterium]
MTKKRSSKTPNDPPEKDPDAPRVSVDVNIKSREIAKRLPAIGYVTWLCSQSQSHRQLFVQDMEWRLFPPVILGQYKLRIQGKAGGLPTAYASWAFLSEELENDFRATHKLRPGDWRSGDRPWLVDCIAPFGGAIDFLEELQLDVLADQEVQLFYPGANGSAAETTLVELIKHRSKPGASTQRNSAHSPRH